MIDSSTSVDSRSRSRSVDSNEDKSALHLIEKSLGKGYNKAKHSMTTSADWGPCRAICRHRPNVAISPIFRYAHSILEISCSLNSLQSNLPTKAKCRNFSNLPICVLNTISWSHPNVSYQDSAIFPICHIAHFPRAPGSSKATLDSRALMLQMSTIRHEHIKKGFWLICRPFPLLDF